MNNYQPERFPNQRGRSGRDTDSGYRSLNRGGTTGHTQPPVAEDDGYLRAVDIPVHGAVNQAYVGESQEGVYERLSVVDPPSDLVMDSRQPRSGNPDSRHNSSNQNSSSKYQRNDSARNNNPRRMRRRRNPGGTSSAPRNPGQPDQESGQNDTTRGPQRPNTQSVRSTSSSLYAYLREYDEEGDDWGDDWEEDDSEDGYDQLDDFAVGADEHCNDPHDYYNTEPNYINTQSSSEPNYENQRQGSVTAAALTSSDAAPDTDIANDTQMEIQPTRHQSAHERNRNRPKSDSAFERARLTFR